MKTLTLEQIRQQSFLLINGFIANPAIEKSYAGLLGEHELCFPLDLFAEENVELYKEWLEVAEQVVRQHGYVNTCTCSKCVEKETKIRDIDYKARGNVSFMDLLK